MRASASDEATNRSSSPAAKTSWALAVITRPSRTIAARAASSGSSISSTVLPIHEDPSGRVNSTRFA